MNLDRLRRVTLGIALIGITLCAHACTRPEAAIQQTAPRIEASRVPSSDHQPLSALSAERYRANVSFLAHDELGGRGTGSDEIDLAAGYLAGQFAAAGLLPAGPGGTYFQEFNIANGGEVLDTTLLGFTGVDAPAILDTDFRPFGFSATGPFEGEVVFVGYGITNDDKDYDDYAEVDVSGKVALMLRRAPSTWRPGAGFSKHARFDKKVELAAGHGAIAVFIFNQAPGEGGADRLRRFSPEDAAAIPALHIKRSLAEKLLAVEGLDDLTALQSRLDEGDTQINTALAKVRVSGTVDYEVGEILARNVLGVLPSTDRHADEYVVIGAHYDHLGIQGGQVHNGADDNASGTAALVELAHAFSASRDRNRSVLFIGFTGEELGLHGSQHFVSQPTIPLKSVAAMLNMDMIGRLDHEDDMHRLGIQGLGTGESFQGIVDLCTSAAGIPYIPDPSALGPSDHKSFYEAGIPSLFFFTGVHADYHRPGDDVDKLNIAGAMEVVSLVYEIASRLVNGEDAPRYAQVDQRAKIFRGAAFGRRGLGRPSGVVMGIVPDRDDDPEAQGWQVVRVIPDGPAAAGGMRNDDVIMEIDGTKIFGWSNYRDFAGEKKPGDVVSVSVRRGNETLNLSIELAARNG